MIRWSYALPRLLLLTVAFLAVWFGLDPLVRRALVLFGEAALSARVEIGALRTSWRPVGLSIRQLRVANRFSPLTNLLEADQIVLSLDAKALKRRSLVVREGRISGLKVNTDRDGSGELDWRLRFPGEPLARLAEAWLYQAAGLLESQVREEVEQLESVRLAGELAVRWPAEYGRMAAQVESLKTRAEMLGDCVRSRSNDVLQEIEAYRRAAGELEELRSELRQLRAEAERLPQHAAADRNAVLAAAHRDLERIQRKIELRRLDSEAVSQYLLGPELGDKVFTLLRWVAWTRRHFPSVSPLEPSRSRGTDVFFPSTRNYPAFSIQTLALDGELCVGDQLYRFRGTAEGLTSEPRVYGRPAVVRIEAAGRSAVRIEAVLDHTRPVPHEQLLIDCPALPMPRRVLGRPERLALAVSPGSMRVWAGIDLLGDQLSGEVRVKQEPIELVPCLAASYGGPRLAENLRQAMSQVRSVELAVHLSGTLDRPEWQFQSNLAPQLVACLGAMVQCELETRQAELVQAARKRMDAELAQLQELVLVKQDEILGRLDLGGTELQELAREVARRLRAPTLERLLGEKLEAKPPVRF
jgi:uncharacterized protein (TIGR03545 family)